MQYLMFEKLLCRRVRFYWENYFWSKLNRGKISPDKAVRYYMFVSVSLSSYPVLSLPSRGVNNKNTITARPFAYSLFRVHPT